MHTYRSHICTALRMWSADCAARVLPIWIEQHPEDDSPRVAILAARKGDPVAAANAADAAAAAAKEAYRTDCDALASGDAADAAAAAARAVFLIANARYAAEFAEDAAIAYAYTRAMADAAADANAIADKAQKNERKWQLQRLREWLSDTPPEPIPV